MIEEIDSVTKRFLVGLESRLQQEDSCIEIDKEVNVENVQSPLKNSADIDISDLTMRYSTDLIFSCLYKQQNLVNYKTDEDPFTRVVEESIFGVRHPIIELSMSLPLLRPIVKWLILNFHKFGQMKAKVIGFIKEQTAFNLLARQEMAKAMRAGIDLDLDSITLSDGRVFKPNMMDGFTDSYHEGKVTAREYLHTSYFFTLAGVATLADVLGQMLQYLAIHGEVQERLRESVLRDGIESEYLS